ncbi:MAG: DUF4412 domain-containing protein [Bacteroidales bacterium]|nr:DUF4412 domain-containing protein [Bacteroidales bacterium]
MKKIIILTIGMFLFCGMIETQGQIEQLLKNKAKELGKKSQKKVEKKIDKAVDKKMDEELDKAEDKIKNRKKKSKDKEENVSEEESINNEDTYSQENDNEPVQQSYGTGDAIPTESSYSFDGNIIMEISQTGSKKNENMLYQSFFNKNNETYATKFISDNSSGQNPNVIMIFDKKNNAMITLNQEDNQKTGVVTSLNMAAGAMNMDVEESGKSKSEGYYNYKKTGNTKVINGYKCDEYLMENPEFVTRTWFTKDFDIGSKGMFGNINYLNQAYSGSHSFGFMMEMVSNNNKTNEQMIIKVKEINLNKSEIIDISTYQLMNMNVKY